MEVGKLIIYLTAIDQTAKAFKSCAGRMSKLESLAGSLSKALMVAFAAKMIVEPVQRAIETYVEFEKSMKDVQAVTGATGEEFKALTEFAREMGRTTVFQAKEAAEMMYYLASAGLKTGQIMDATLPILELAAATQYDLARTGELVVSTMKAYGLETSDVRRITNVFAAAIAGSQARMDRLGESLKYVGAIAPRFNITLEESVAILAKLYDVGIDASMAGTAMRRAIAALTDITPEATETLSAYGIKISEVDFKGEGFIDMIERLEKADVPVEEKEKHLEKLKQILKS